MLNPDWTLERLRRAPAGQAARPLRLHRPGAGARPPFGVDGECSPGCWRRTASCTPRASSRWPTPAAGYATRCAPARGRERIHDDRVEEQLPRHCAKAASPRRVRRRAPRPRHPAVGCRRVTVRTGARRRCSAARRWCCAETTPVRRNAARRSKRCEGNRTALRPDMGQSLRTVPCRAGRLLPPFQFCDWPGVVSMIFGGGIGPAGVRVTVSR